MKIINIFINICWMTSAPRNRQVSFTEVSSRDNIKNHTTIKAQNPTCTCDIKQTIRLSNLCEDTFSRATLQSFKSERNPDVRFAKTCSTYAVHVKHVLMDDHSPYLKGLLQEECNRLLNEYESNLQCINQLLRQLENQTICIEIKYKDNTQHFYINPQENSTTEQKLLPKQQMYTISQYIIAMLNTHQKTTLEQLTNYALI